MGWVGIVGALLLLLLLVLAAVGCGLGDLYLVRAALVDVGGFALGGAVAETSRYGFEEP